MTDPGNPEKFSRPLPQAAAAFAYAGALPFVILALIAWYPVQSFEPGTQARTIIETMLGFSVVILSFMGGVRWGAAAGTSSGPTFSDLAISIVPPAAAWLVMVLASDWMYSQADWINSISPSLLENWRHAAQLFMMVLAFFFLLVVDLKGKGRMPDWYLGWRIPWTLLVEASLIAALVRTIQLQMAAV